MKNESILIVESILKNPLGFLKLDTPQVYENMTVIPIIVQDDKLIDFITIKEAEEAELIEIIETEAVSQLEVINKSDNQVLIPFGMTVHGGKQDRTIWEPILLPIGAKKNVFARNSQKSGQKYTIPAKCVEQSRWSYKAGRGFKSSNTRLHPNVAYEAISAAGHAQDAVWQEIQSHRTEMSIAHFIAPTQSYLEISKSTEKQTQEFTKHFKNVENQCGFAVFINGEFIGIELYANSDAWKSMSNDIFKAFSIEALRFKDKPLKKEKIDYHDEIIKVLGNIEFQFSIRNGIGLGNVVEFTSSDNKWRGITLVLDTTTVQFYLVSKRGGHQYKGRPDLQFQTVINQRYQI